MRKGNSNTRNVILGEPYTNNHGETVVGIHLSVSRTTGLWLSHITEGEATKSKPFSVDADADELRKIAQKINELADYLER